MFNNSGNKCMSLAKWFFWIGCVIETAAVIVIISILGWDDGTPALLCVLPFVWLLNWVCSLIIYTIGATWANVRRVYEKTIGGKMYEEN